MNKELMVKKIKQGQKMNHRTDSYIEDIENMDGKQIEYILRQTKKKNPKEKILRYLGKDKRNWDVYKDEVGLYWKRESESSGLYYSPNFHGEPFLPIDPEIICRIYHREE